MNESPLDTISTTSEIALTYALLTVGQNEDESKIMRLRMADVARELGHATIARMIEDSLGTVARIEEYSRRAS